MDENMISIFSTLLLFLISTCKYMLMYVFQMMIIALDFLFCDDDNICDLTNIVIIFMYQGELWRTRVWMWVSTFVIFVPMWEFECECLLAFDLFSPFLDFQLKIGISFSGNSKRQWLCCNSWRNWPWGLITF